MGGREEEGSYVEQCFTHNRINMREGEKKAIELQKLIFLSTPEIIISIQVEFLANIQWQQPDNYN